MSHQYGDPTLGDGVGPHSPVTLFRPLPLLISGGLIISALIGVWAAYDREQAWMRFSLISIGVALMLGIAWMGWRGRMDILGIFGLLCALLGAAIGAYFLLTFDWAGNQGKFAPIQAAGLWLQVHRPAIPVPEDINANVAGSSLAILLPLGAVGLFWGWSRDKRTVAIIAALSLLFGFLILFLTQSRAAWLGLAAGLAVALYLAVRPGLENFPRRRLLLDLVALAGGLLVLVLFWLVASSPTLAESLGSIGVGVSLTNRAELWRDGMNLVADYPFTGSGLGSTMMVYSTYGRLLHVGFITHMHNLFLQITIEQGIPGLLFFLLLLVLAWWSLLSAYRSGENRCFCVPVAASLVALVVQGLVDVGIYASYALPVLFLPIGFALALGQPPRVLRRSKNVTLALTSVSIIVVAMCVVLIVPSSQAALQANLGAVAQTQRELSAYSWPEWPIQDALRRSPDIDLSAAIARYKAALDRDPKNATGNRRLGQIELSRGRYEAARWYLEAAYATSPRQSVTRHLLGEVYAIDGDLDLATSFLRSVDIGHGQFQTRVWWYETVGETEGAQRLREAGGF
ncbi:MAG: O-antigen ligase family protein [Chloroflexota bacterium]|nr:O-antigen ligase family protein [Chloroflexota bacterium]